MQEQLLPHFEYQDDDPLQIDDVGDTIGSKKREKLRITTNLVSKVLYDMGITVGFNLITNQLEIDGMESKYSKTEASTTLPVVIRDYMIEHMGVDVSRNRIMDCLHVISDLNRFNPVIDMIANTAYDGGDRITVLYDILGLLDIATDSEATKEQKRKYRLYLNKWLHQCVAMAFNNEDEPYGADGVLVLKGEQGIGKTTFFRVIAVNPAWFCEGKDLNVYNKDAKIEVTGKWIVELGEIDGTLKLKQSSLKSFVGSGKDELRAPWARTAVTRPRRASFCGTVNEEQFLTDETGNRRYWIIKVEKIKLDVLLGLTKDWLYQMWAQVYQNFYLPDPQGFRLTQGELIQLQKDNIEFLTPIPGETEFLETLRWDCPVEKWKYITMSELCHYIGGVNNVQAGKAIMRLQRQDHRIKSKKAHNNLKKYLLPPIDNEDEST